MKKANLFVLLITCSLLLGTLYGQQRGYTARACGLDMNRNGIIGEAADCNVCDGTTTDVDGDGFDEDLYYVDSVSGSDTGGCGTTGSPCATISYTIDNEVDGPGTGQEDIVCIQGTFTENIINLASGITGFYTINATGSQATNFQYPDNPFMIVGWDTDDDGSYPPFDTDETAIIDGSSLSSGAAFANGTLDDSYIEIAHLTVQDFAQRGFVDPGRGNMSHIYFHDIEALRMVDAKQVNPGGSFRAYNLFVGNLDWFASVNMKFTDQGGYFARGSPTSGAGAINWKWQNITVLFNGLAGNDIAGFKLWDSITGIEILDSIFDAQPDLWNPDASPPATSAIILAQCSQDWVIRNNELIDFAFGVLMQPAASGFCSSQGITGTIIDQNRISNTYDPWSGNIGGIKIQPGGGASNTIEDVTITNNFIWDTTANTWDACIYSEAGSTSGPNPGTITIAGNTCFGDMGTAAYFIDDRASVPKQNYVFKNNIAAATNSGTNMRIDYGILNWDADGNVFDPAGNYSWSGGNQSSISAWRTASGQDANSTECDPAFVNAGAGDLHLLNNELCAINGGIDITAITTKDLDGQTRSSTSPDSGADEVMGSSSAPSPPANLRTVY